MSSSLLIELILPILKRSLNIREHFSSGFLLPGGGCLSLPIFCLSLWLMAADNPPGARDGARKTTRLPHQPPNFTQTAFYTVSGTPAFQQPNLNRIDTHFENGPHVE
ncbi:hypothetical protein EYF80_045177 [Liparis tanakae]|uniref:Uncharacterized protein n=1 Tax=Liparis tanakae TaxID=230148 RepID=A0A4Z2FTM8_9TELE|nr:hypothetical protein EYF80_045177 [Liparis tanakae]